MLSGLTVRADCPDWSEWLRELVAAVRETVFALGTPVVDDASKWPALDVLASNRALLQQTFANNAYALSFLGLCIVMGAKESKPLEGSAEEQQQLAAMLASYPRYLMLREKNFGKPWLSTFYAHVIKFYRTSIPLAFQGLVTRQINA